MNLNTPNFNIECDPMEIEQPKPDNNIKFEP